MAIQMFSRQLLKSIVSNGCSNQTRQSSILSALQSSPVLVSSNKDVYTNLALEHWLYTNLRFNQDNSAEKTANYTNFGHPIVLIWTDEPCVVMGRHQNPWVETTLGLINKLGIKLARRHSGGGCVYHDDNNVNISIIGDRKIFDKRQENLKFLANILGDKYGVNCEPNKRHDLIHTRCGRKMSGSAAKLGRFNSYHHFTLLVNTDIEIMNAVLRQKQQDFITTNSSFSKRSDVINLSELRPELTIDKVIADISQAYGKHYKVLNDSNKLESNANQKFEGSHSDLESLQKFKADLMNWNWIYGMTPRLKLERCISFIEAGITREAQFKVYVNRGLFEKFEIDSDLESIQRLVEEFNNKLIDTKFTYTEAMVNVVKMLQVDDNGNMSSLQIAGTEQIFATHLLQMIQESNC